MQDRDYDSVRQEERSEPVQFEIGKNPLPETVTEYIQKARDELKQYEEHKKFYETTRKKEIILDLSTLLEEHRYPKDLLRSILARELGDYISTRYIEKILAEKYPNKKELKEQSSSQIANSSRNDNKISIEVSSTGESIVIHDNGDPDSTKPNLEKVHDNTNPEVPAEIKTDIIERQMEQEQGTGDIANVKVLQTQIKDLQIKCSRFEQLANESLVWKEKYTQLQQEFATYRNKIIRRITQVEFGSEFLPLNIEYNFKTNQFSARIPEEIIKRILTAVRSYKEKFEKLPNDQYTNN